MQPPGALPHEAPDAAADFFELSRDMLCVFDAHGRFISVNPAWTQFLGYTETELLGKHLHELVHPEDRDKTSIEARRLSLMRAARTSRTAVTPKTAAITASTGTRAWPTVE